jgi:hypothetical protein
LNVDVVFEIITENGEDDIKVGKHIQTKLRELSDSGLHLHKNKLSKCAIWIGVEEHSLTTVIYHLLR